MKLVRWTALLFLAAGLAACSGEDEQVAVDTTAAVDGSTTAAVSTTEEVAASEPESAPAAPVTFAVDAPLLEQAFDPVEPGTYRVDTLGTPFTFTIGESLFVQPNGRGMFVLSHPNSSGPDDRDIVMLRMPVLSDPAQVIPGSAAEADWPANDFAGWLDGLSDEVIVLDRQETTLGGLDATYAELKLVDETDCTSRIPCRLGWNRIQGKAMAANSTYRVWMVEQGDEDALAVIVGISRDSEEEWFDTADAVLETLAFDTVGPNPVAEASGTVELDYLGGVRVELAQPAVAIQEPGGYGAIALVRQPADVEFLFAPKDVDGDPVATTADLVTLLEGSGVVVTEIEATEVDGLPARVFEIGAAQFVELLSRTAETEAFWSPSPRGRIWSVEHPERGLLVITAEAFAEPDAVFPLILELAEPIVDSMEFIELG